MVAARPQFDAYAVNFVYENLTPVVRLRMINECKGADAASVRSDVMGNVCSRMAQT